MNPRRRNSLAASPLLIGALTVLIAVVAVYVSYGANNGLPFTPTYDIKAELPEASGLEKGNQVRLFGRRIGIVSGIVPTRAPATGKVTAIVSLKLEKHAGAAARRHHDGGPIGVDDRPEVPGTEAGALSADDPRGRDDSRLARQRTGGDPGFLQHVRQADADRDSAEHQRLRRRLRGTRSRASNKTFHTLRPLVEQRRAGAAQPRLAPDRLRPAVRGARQIGSADLAGGRDAGGVVPGARHLLHRLRRRLALAGTYDRRRPGGAAPGDPLAPVRAAVLRQRRPSSCACCGRARRSWQRSRRRSATPSRSAPSTFAPPPP